jgi:uncharacterized protein
LADIFADTAGWGHLVDKSQGQHARAAQVYRTVRQTGGRIITTNYILAEVVALLTNPLRIPRAQLIAFVESIKASIYVTIVHVDPLVDAAAWQLLTNRVDKAWSLVDCTSFIVMEQMQLTEALTTDHHFAQAGFVPLLR